MSLHISAEKGEIAEIVLMPGDPMRAQFLAENFLTDAKLYNQVRGMFGFTGTYKGKRVSIQGSGMGMPSISIYAHELINEYNVKKIIRIGTCGTFQEHIKLKDIILAQGASTDSAMNKPRFPGAFFAPLANFEMLLSAYNLAKERNLNIHVGNILSSDTFYDENPEAWKNWAKYNVLAVEMEAAALYTLAARFKVDALTILTVTDKLFDHSKKVSPKEREKALIEMGTLALDVALNKN
ncbi:MAG: purine-nucleoside phosphorylase [Luteibaculaceae bacterium]